MHEHVIVAFVDNNLQKQGTMIGGVRIISPAEIPSFEYDYICLMSSYQYEMLEQLTKLGIERDKILEFTEAGVLQIQKRDYLSISDLADCDIILISHLMNHTGATLALLELSKVIIKRGYKCSVLTVFDGDLREAFEKEGVSVYEENLLDEKNEELCSLLKKKRMIVFNTIIFWRFVNALQLNGIKVIWWIHEAIGYRYADFSPFRINHQKNLHVYGVGEKACDLYRTKFMDDSISIFLYKVDERMFQPEKEEHEKTVFALIGRIDREKGQDIFVDAIKALAPEIREKCKFKIIGNADNEGLYTYLLEESKIISELQICGEMNREELRESYKGIDVIVSASREETMSMVITEGMLNKKCCIMSPYIGMASYTHNGIDGLVMNDLTFNELADKIKWVVENRDKADAIGEKGFNIYRSFFSEEAFEKNVGEVLDKHGL